MWKIPTVIKVVLIFCFGLFVFSLVGFPFLLTMALSNSGGSDLDRAWFFFGVILSILITVHLLYSLFSPSDYKFSYVNLQIKTLLTCLLNKLQGISINWKQRWLIGIIFLMSLMLVFKIIVILDDNYLRIDDKIHELAISEVITLQLERDDNTKIIIEWSLWELQSDQMSKSYNFTNEQLVYIKEEYVKRYDTITFKFLVLVWAITLFLGWLLSLLVMKFIKIY